MLLYLTEIALLKEAELVQAGEEAQPRILIHVSSGENIESGIVSAKSRTRSQDILVCLLFLDDNAFITSAWSPEISTPCPCCCLDYVFERSYFDPVDRVMSIGDAIEVLESEGFKAPTWSPVSRQDLSFAMRYLSQYIEILSGVSSSWGGHRNPMHLTTISLSELTATNFQIPFSDSCSCLQESYLLNKAFMHA